MNFDTFTPFLRIMTLQAGPQDLQYNNKLLIKLLLLYIATALLALLPGSKDLFASVVLLVLDLLVLVAFLKFCLYTRNTSARFWQTFLACLGVGLIFQIIALPLIWYLNSGVESAQNSGLLAGIAYMVLVGWQISVMAHILRHAMNMLISLTLMLSFAYFVLMVFISNQLMTVLASV